MKKDNMEMTQVSFWRQNAKFKTVAKLGANERTK